MTADIGAPLEVRTDPDTRRVELAGELDMATAPQLIEGATPLVGSDGDITIGLAGVTFLDSSGIAALLDIGRALAGRGRVLLSRPRPNVRRVLQLTGLCGPDGGMAFVDDG